MNPPVASIDQLDHRAIMKILAGLMVTLFLGALDQTIVATAGPTIVGELGAFEALPWIFSSYMLASTVTVPLYGKLGDLYGRRFMLQIAVVIFVVGSVASGAAQTMPQLVGARALQGLGAGGIVPLALAIVGDIIPPRTRGRYMGYITSVFAAASVSGPLIGGFFVDQLSWRWGFHINLPLSIVALYFIRRNLPKTAPAARVKIDYLGAGLLTSGLTSLLMATIVAEQSSLTSPAVLLLAAGGAAALVAFVFVERVAEAPIIPLDLFKDRVFTLTTVVGLFMGLAMFSAIVYMPVFLQIARGLSATASGMAMVPMMLMLALSSTVAGRIISRLGRFRSVGVVGSALVAVASFALVFLTLGTPVALISIAVGVLGAGVGAGMPTLTTAMQNSVPMHHLGIATGLSQFFRSIASVFGVAIYGAILNARVASDLAAFGIDDPSEVINDPASVAELPLATRDAIGMAIASGLTVLLVIGAVAAAISLAATLRLPDDELRDRLNPVAPPPGPDASDAAVEAPAVA